MSLKDEISAVLNRHSAENGSNTPDFILAQYLERCLDAFNEAVQARAQWYAPGQPNWLAYTCPTCAGTRQVSRPPTVPGDVTGWAGTTCAVYTCPTCDGTGLVWRLVETATITITAAEQKCPKCGGKLTYLQHPLKPLGVASGSYCPKCEPDHQP